jgi:gas vesicle protein
MNADTPDTRDYRFLIGLVTGSIVGAGLALWLVPRAASELRERVTNSAKRVGQRAADRYEDASDRVGEAVDELARQGENARDGLADAVARGAHEVERFARAAKSDRQADGRTPVGL